MKFQNILRTQAIVIGFGAALFFASSAPAQEIVNTEYPDGPYVTNFDQPAASAPATVSASAAASSASWNPSVTNPAPVVYSRAISALESSAEQGLLYSSILGAALLALYPLAEILGARRHQRSGPSFTRRPVTS